MDEGVQRVFIPVFCENLKSEEIEKLVRILRNKGFINEGKFKLCFALLLILSKRQNLL